MDEPTAYAWIDTQQVLILGLLLALVLFVSLRAADPAPADLSAYSGALTVSIRWAPGAPTDVDLWVRTPSDRGVGYSARDGRNANLLRDDLGTLSDPGPENFEVVSIREAAPGRYVVNVHAYRGAVPMPVEVAVQALDPVTRLVATLWTRTVLLSRVGQEITAGAFDLDQDGRYVPSSLDHTYTPVRSGAKP